MIKKYLFYFVLVNLIILIFLSLFFKENILRENNFICLQFLFIMIFSFSNLFFNGEKINLIKIFYFFTFFFFGLAPFFQYLENKTMWGGDYIKDVTYIKFNFLIIIILLLFYVFYKIFYKIRKNKKQKMIVILKKRKTYYLMIFLMVLLSLIYIKNLSVIDFLRDAGGTKSVRIENPGVSLIISKFLKPAPMILYFYMKLENEKLPIRLVILLVAIVVNFPLALSRNATALLYLPLLLIEFPILKYKNRSIIVMFIGLSYIFPFMNNFRTYYKTKVINMSLDFNMYLQGHFDTYQTFLFTFREDIISYGRQLLGVFLFFIPRQIWNSKPIGSGGYISKILNLNFDYISLNYFGEGYINFGYVGILIFLIILAYICGRLDYDFKTSEKKQSNFKKIFYYAFLSNLFFLLRGDLISGYSYFVAFILSTFFIEKIFYTKNKIVLHE